MLKKPKTSFTVCTKKITIIICKFVYNDSARAGLINTQYFTLIYLFDSNNNNNK